MYYNSNSDDLHLRLKMMDEVTRGCKLGDQKVKKNGIKYLEVPSWWRKGKSTRCGGVGRMGSDL